MAQALASTVFSTQPTEALITVDAYQQTTASDTITAVKDNTQTEDSKEAISSVVVGAKESVGDQTENAKEQVADAKEVLVESLDQSPTMSSAFNALEKETKATVLDGIKRDIVDGTGVGNTLASVGNTTKLLTSTNLKSLKGLSTLVSGISNTPFPIDLKNPKLFASSASAILREATTKGLPGVFKAFSDGTTDETILGRVTKDLLPHMVSTSNVDLLYDMATGKTKKDIKAFMPSVATDFVQAFKSPGKMSIGQKMNLLNTVGSGLSEIDSKWDKWAIGPDKTQMCTKMDSYLGASDDMRELVSDVANAQKAVLSTPQEDIDPGIVFPNDDNVRITAVANMVTGETFTPRDKGPAIGSSDETKTTKVLGLFGFGVYVPDKYKAAISQMSNSSSRPKPASTSAAEQLAADFPETPIVPDANYL